MDSFDFFYIDSHRPDPHPLTKVDFFHAKHRALKEANAVAAARGLPPRKSAALYIDMAVVRNFDHYDDIGVTPDDPVARDLVRRQELEAVQAERQGKIEEEAREEAREKHKIAAKEAREARLEQSRRVETLRAEEELQRAKARLKTMRRVREDFSRQSRPGKSGAVAAPAIHAPRNKKRKQAEVEANEEASKKVAVEPVVDNSKEQEAFDEWLARIPMPSIEFDNDQENSPSQGRKRRAILDSDDEEEMSPSTAIKSEADIA
ncbi:hypothetical protein H2200_010421 [Cladophialophora chaetospira]|uniref:Uncharacterized protein n=1 Tax=Cladophialophora chaetospira TaxID=386627 RepID=A0AA39CEA8_9EURO|nr:hypothetical protein H2200_010421 [Cladophialophora chaetospira]